LTKLTYNYMPFSKIQAPKLFELLRKQLIRWGQSLLAHEIDF